METPEWKRHVADSINSPSRLPSHIRLTEEETAFFSQATAETRATFLVTRYYCNLSTDAPDDPIRKQFLPSVFELTHRPYESSDPLHESTYSPVPRLIHRYSDRVLVLATGQCASYCRHCFRRYFAGRVHSILKQEELDQITAYLAQRPEVHEVILSGGDPLTLDDAWIEEILRRIRIVKPNIRFRIATRIPVVLPSRITSSLLVLLRRFAPLWIVTQYNHPTELSEESCDRISECIDIGIPVLNQAVLLRGINDSKEVLEKLFQKLLNNRIKPYYLFQGDLASGTGHFRTPIGRGLELMKNLDQELSGLAMPFYAVDLPHGGGKIKLTEASVLSRKRGWYTLQGRSGDLYHYPDES